MTEVREETAVDRTVANGKRTGQAAEQTWDAVLGASGTAQEGMRKAHDATIDAFKQWSDRLAGTPITLLSGDAGAVLSGKAWVDGTFEVTETLLAAQRRYIDQFLTNQRQLVGSLLDSNFSLAKAMWHVTRSADNGQS
jgi:hypothetical protein